MVPRRLISLLIPLLAVHSVPPTLHIPALAAAQHLCEDAGDFSQTKALKLFQNTAHPDATEIAACTEIKAAA